MKGVIKFLIDSLGNFETRERRVFDMLGLVEQRVTHLHSKIPSIKDRLRPRNLQKQLSHCLKTNEELYERLNQLSHLQVENERLVKEVSDQRVLAED